MFPKGEHALALARAGFKVFPLREDNPDEEPSEIKKPALEGDWKKLATTDETKIQKWWTRRNYNIAVATLPGEDLAILDYDMKDGQNGAAALRMHDMLDLPQGLRVRTASGGVHVYLRLPQGVSLPNSVSKVAKHVDVRGNERGGYVVGPGSTIHGKSYAIESGNPDFVTDQFPDWMFKLATANRRSLKTKQGEQLGEVDDPTAVKRAIEYLKDNAPEAREGEGGDQTTFKVACHVRDFGLSEQTTLELLVEHWNDTKALPAWSPDELSQKVRNAYAYASLPAGVSNPQNEFEAVEIEKPAPSEKEKARELHSVPFDKGAAEALERMGEPLIDELLEKNSLSTLYGPSNSGKTFLALDLAHRIAAGLEWHGARKVKQGLIVYVATEGGRGIFKRLAALKKHFGTSNIPLVTVPCPINLLDPGKAGDTKRLIDLIRDIEAEYGLTVEMVVIDTLSRALAGGDENAATDMGVFIKHVDRIRAAFDAHVMLVHHTGKDVARGARGWSGIRAAIDTEIEINEGKITVTKQRDIEAIEPIKFRLEAVPIGRRRQDDKIVSSCVVKYVTASEFEIELDKNEQKMLSLLQEHLAEKTTKGEGVAQGSTSEILLALGDARGVSGKVLTRTSLIYWLSKLSEKGAIEKEDNDQWVIPGCQNGLTPF